MGTARGRRGQPGTDEIDVLQLRERPRTPDGVFARAVDGRILYVNTTGDAKDVPLDGQWTGVLSKASWQGKLHLAPYGVDLVETGKAR
jgi:beta-galactosidase